MAMVKISPVGGDNKAKASKKRYTTVVTNFIGQ